MNEPISTSRERRPAAFDPLEALTVRESGTLLHVSRPTVEKYIKRGELPSVLIGRCRRIRRTDLEAFLADRTESGWRRTDDPSRAADRSPSGWPDADMAGPRDVPDPYDVADTPDLAEDIPF